MNMSVNSSSSADSPSLPPGRPSTAYPHPLMNNCFRSKTIIYIFSAVFITYIFLLPVLIIVLYLGYQQWRKQRFVSTATRSHSDLFTYHSIAIQLNEFLGFIVFFCGSYINLPDMFVVGTTVLSVTSLGKALFQLLTCVERYLAVVHPIVYLGLRQAGGVKIRNISIACVWLLSCGHLAVAYLASYEVNMILYYCCMVFFFITIAFCSIAVLRALKRPGPGGAGRNRERVDQTKQRAFHTIMVIMGVLLSHCGGNLIATALHSSSVLRDACLVMVSTIWFNLPSSLVLPLLFLHRAGKLPCCKQNNHESGYG